MESRLRVAGHPLHPMIVMFPVALLPLLVLLDALQAWLQDDVFWTVGFWVAVAGLVTALAAIVTGLPDMAAVPSGTRAHRTALFHAIVGTTIALVYAAAIWARWPVGSAPDRFLVAVDVVGLLLVTVQGWLGGELVYKHHLGVRAPAEGGDPVTLEPASARRGAPGRARRPGV